MSETPSYQAQVQAPLLQPAYAAQPAMAPPVYPAGLAPPVPAYVTMMPGQQLFPLSNTVSFSEIPANVTCAFCGKSGMTTTRYVPGLLTWLVAGGCVFFGCIFGCCLVPFCVDGCKDVIHTCSHCKSIVGEKRRI